MLIGDNGSGKTNLLEAVSLLGPGHGLRSRPYGELCRKDGAGGFAVAATGGVARGRGRDRHRHRPPARAKRARGAPCASPARTQSAGALCRARQAGLAHPGDGWPVHRARLRSGGVSSTGSCLPSIPKMRSPLKAATTAPCGSGTACSSCARARRALFEGLEEQMAEAGTAIAAARLDAIARLAGLIERMRAARGEGPFPWARDRARRAARRGAVAAVPRPRSRTNFARLLEPRPRARPGRGSRP